MLSLILTLALSAGPDLGVLPGRTIVSTHPDGRQARLTLQAGNRYSAIGRKGQRSGGTWQLKDGRLCLNQTRPYRGPFPVCRAVPNVKPGQPWKDRAFNGEPVINRIEP